MSNEIGSVGDHLLQDDAFTVTLLSYLEGEQHARVFVEDVEDSTMGDVFVKEGRVPTEANCQTHNGDHPLQELRPRKEC